MNNRIKLCILDLGGTIVDKYSLSPFISLKHAFKRKGINIPNKLIFQDMGKDKYDHIRIILDDKYVSRQWMQVHGNYPNVDSTMNVFDEFIKYQINEGISNIDILPETKNTINWLKENNIKTGITTGFSRPIMNAIKEKIIDDNIHIDEYVSSTCLGKPGRPNPHMMNSIINKFSISDKNSIIKIDDTCVGIEEGKNAGTLTIGVAKWSTNMKMTDYSQEKNMSKEEYVERLKNSREELWKASPDYVIDSLEELPRIINMINSEN